jgi:hypothetical protein
MTDTRQPDFEWRGLQVWITAPGTFRVSVPRGFDADVERVLVSPRFRRVLREKYPEIDFDETEAPLDDQAQRVMALMAQALLQRR